MIKKLILEINLFLNLLEQVLHVQSHNKHELLLVRYLSEGQLIQ